MQLVSSAGSKTLQVRVRNAACSSSADHLGTWIGTLEHPVGLLAVPPVPNASLLKRWRVGISLLKAGMALVLSSWRRSNVETTVSPSTRTTPLSASSTSDTSWPSACSSISHGASATRAGRHLRCCRRAPSKSAGACGFKCGTAVDRTRSPHSCRFPYTPGLRLLPGEGRLFESRFRLEIPNEP